MQTIWSADLVVLSHQQGEYFYGSSYIITGNTLLNDHLFQYETYVHENDFQSHIDV